MTTRNITIKFKMHYSIIRYGGVTVITFPHEFSPLTSD